MGSLTLSKKKQQISVKKNLTAGDFKERGNRFFHLKKFSSALRSYTKAIELNSNESTFFTNRALCNLQMKNWSLVCQDCKTAIDLDPNKVKGYVYLGHALIEMSLFDESILYLIKADQLLTNQNQSGNEEVQTLLRLARRGRQAKIDEEELKSLNQLKLFLKKLLFNKKQELLKNLKDFSDESSQIKKKYEKLEEELEILFTKAENLRKQRDIMECLCGKISYELMRDPVTTPAGITYDRGDIEQHLLRVGHFDPITRSPLNLDQLIPNNSMKKVINNYIQENPWAEFY